MSEAMTSPMRMVAEAVAWRVKDYADGWILFHHEAPARSSSGARNGALVQPLYAALPQATGEVRALDVDDLAQEIRRVDGNHSLGAGALAEALMPFLSAIGAGHGSSIQDAQDE